MSFLLTVDQTVALRLVEPQHAPEIVQAVRANVEHIGRRLPWCSDNYDETSCRAWIKASLKEFGERTQLPLSIIEDGQVIGGSGWTEWSQGRNDLLDIETASADIGYWLIEEAQGRGIITRCVAALLDYGFDEICLRRVTIRVEPDNQRSAAVPQRLGFTEEGTHRHVYQWKGRPVNYRVFAMLAEDWPNAKSAWLTRHPIPKT
ncbi:MAG: GNAT family protein [Planctomycetota bacterium]